MEHYFVEVMNILRWWRQIESRDMTDRSRRSVPSALLHKSKKRTKMVTN